MRALVVLIDGSAWAGDAFEDGSQIVISDIRAVLPPMTDEPTPDPWSYARTAGDTPEGEAP